MNDLKETIEWEKKKVFINNLWLTIKRNFFLPSLHRVFQFFSRTNRMKTLRVSKKKNHDAIWSLLMAFNGWNTSKTAFYLTFISICHSTWTLVWQEKFSVFFSSHWKFSSLRFEKGSQFLFSFPLSWREIEISSCWRT